MPEVNSSPRKLTAPQGLYETVSNPFFVHGVARRDGAGAIAIPIPIPLFSSHPRHAAPLTLHAPVAAVLSRSGCT
ncbi:hypothetical protein C6Q19_26065 [Burkholderia cenocepacia]|nr:hypothetical protein C6Q19_26065 [Burkholderia cenocepacia]